MGMLQAGQAAQGEPAGLPQHLPVCPAWPGCPLVLEQAVTFCLATGQSIWFCSVKKHVCVCVCVCVFTCTCTKLHSRCLCEGRYSALMQGDPPPSGEGVREGVWGWARGEPQPSALGEISSAGVRGCLKKGTLRKICSSWVLKAHEEFTKDQRERGRIKGQSSNTGWGF